MKADLHLSYQVDKNCESTGTDAEKPTDFTATVGQVAANSVELLLKASDNSGNVIFTITYGTTNLNVSAASGVLKSCLVMALTPVTDYTFSISVSDANGNSAVNNPITLNATTAANMNTGCAGLLAESSQGSAFSIGYKYSFVTTGTDVKITFELFDDRSQVVAYLWKQTPFAETAMTLVSGKIFTKTISGQTNGSTISYACKFAYEGGLSVTKYLSYVVGNDCAVTAFGSTPETKQTFFPNPVQNILHLQLFDLQNFLVLTDIHGKRVLEQMAGSTTSLDISNLKPGMYFLRIENAHGIQNLKVIKK